MFSPAGNRDVRVAQGNRLSRRNNRLQARAAQPVQRQRRRVLRDAAIHRRDPRQIHILRFSVDHVAEHDVLHLGAIDMAARQRFPHHLGAEFRGRNILQTTTKVADRSTNPGYDENLALHGRAPYLRKRLSSSHVERWMQGGLRWGATCRKRKLLA